MKITSLNRKYIKSINNWYVFLLVPNAVEFDRKVCLDKTCCLENWRPIRLPRKLEPTAILTTFFKSLKLSWLGGVTIKKRLKVLLSNAV